ncbi:hypothetical protein [Allorhodopirellula heiligendammensis]|nr:hypothetical protein [Allorhodopirellula heiligendammensis]
MSVSIDGLAACPSRPRVRRARHGVLANGVHGRGSIGAAATIDKDRDPSDLARIPPLVDAAHTAGLPAAEINWPGTRESNSFDNSFST